MNKELPIVNRLIHKRELERANDLLMTRIMRIKYSNISSLQGHSEKKVSRPHAIDYAKVVTASDKKQPRVSTTLDRQTIKQQNKKIYDRLVKQKPTLSTKTFAYERHRNLEFLKRIGRYPYRRVQSTSLQPLDEQNEDNPTYNQRATFCAMNYQQNESSFNHINLFNNKGQSCNSLRDEQNKEHRIVLFNRVANICKNWYTIQFLRMKNHYQIAIQHYPSPKAEYSLQLAQALGNSLLSQNDYDYEYIYSNYLKITKQYFCLSFTLASDKKKYFFKFQKRSVGQPAATFEESQHVGNQAYRKTVFALQNQKKQKEEQGRLFRQNTQSDIAFSPHALQRLETESIDIRLSNATQTK